MGHVSGVKPLLSLFLPRRLCFFIHLEETQRKLRKEETVAINNNNVRPFVRLPATYPGPGHGVAASAGRLTPLLGSQGYNL